MLFCIFHTPFQSIFLRQTFVRLALIDVIVIEQMFVVNSFDENFRTNVCFFAKDVL